MRVQMITGFFRYEPCELTVRDGILYLRAADSERAITAGGLSSASLTRMQNGNSRLELTTRGEQFEFLLPDKAADDEARELLYELTRNDGRLELRMRGE